jgi:hypothetical protein
MGKYVIKQTKDGCYMFNLVASNGQVIGTSQTYRALNSAKSGIESVKRISYCRVEDQTVQDVKKLTHPKWELYEDEAGEYRFRLKAMNGEIILASQGYSAKASAQKGLESVKNNAEEAEVVVEE